MLAPDSFNQERLNKADALYAAEQSYQILTESAGLIGANPGRNAPISRLQSSDGGSENDG